MLTQIANGDVAPRVDVGAALETPETERIEVPAPEAMPSPAPVPAAVPAEPAPAEPVPGPVPNGA